MQKAFVIYNPASGQRREQRLRHVNAAVDIMRAGGVQVEVSPTTHAGSAVQQAREAAASGRFDAVIASGGDGTVNEVLNGMMEAGGSAALGVIPLGSGNLLATDLLLPSRAEAAASKLLIYKPREINPGYLLSCTNGQSVKRYFAVAAGVGADAQLMYRTAVESKQRWGRNAYFLEMFRMTMHGRFPLFQVEWQDETGRSRADKVTLVMAIRARKFPGLLRFVNLGSSLQQNEYRLMLFRTDKVRRFLSYFASVASGRNWKVKDVDLVVSRWFRCTPADSAQSIFSQADGELLGGLPAEVGIEQRTFRLLMPEAG